MKYLIDETTREERIEIVKKALAISLSDASYPSEEALQLVEEYIEGRMELEDVQKLMIKKYDRNKEKEVA